MQIYRKINKHCENTIQYFSVNDYKFIKMSKIKIR